MILTSNKHRISSETDCGGDAPFQISSVPRETHAVRWLLVWLLMMAFVPGKFVRAQQITGAIAGTVSDAQAAVVPNALIKASNTNTGFSRTVNSGSAGEYVMQYLPVGNY